MAADDDPVSSVSWDEAQSFCAWLSRKENRRYRLPTDTEWSVAVGLGEAEHPDSNMVPHQKGDAGTASRSVPLWLDHLPPAKPDQRVGNYADQVWQGMPHRTPWITGYNDGYATSAPVMSCPPNAFGLYDLGGNVWEWVILDWLATSSTQAVLRGGSWEDAIDGIRSSKRLAVVPVIHRARRLMPALASAW